MNEQELDKFVERLHTSQEHKKQIKEHEECDKADVDDYFNDGLGHFPIG